MDTLLKVVPATAAIQVVTAAVIVAVLRDYVPSLQLGIWLGLIMVISLVRSVRAIRLRQDPQYASTHPPREWLVCAAVCSLALLWLVIPIAWIHLLPTRSQFIVLVTIAAIMCGGSVALIALPSVALAHLTIFLLNCAVLTLSIQEPQLFFLSFLYAGVLALNVLGNSRQFVAHTRDRIELYEQGEIIKLLREFEASGSGGLWELDADLRFVKISMDLAASAGLTEDRIIGRNYRWLLDPGGQLSEISSGMRSLIDHFDRGVAFRDRAIPSVDRQRWWSISGKPMLDDRGHIVGWRGVASDITDSRLSGDAAVRAARTDPLTRLANRLLVRELVEEASIRQGEGKSHCALLLIDLDRFKLVNDTLGHGIGDQLLVEVGRRLEKAVSLGGRVGRIGGDEFAVVWHAMSDRATLSTVAERIISEVSKTITIGAATLHVGATVGIAIGPGDGQLEEQLMRSADLALYHAKAAGRGGYAFFERHMFDKAEDHRLLEQDVREALNTNGLMLAYQPIVDAKSGRIVCREALLRWRHPLRGDIPPDQFIPIIEDAGLIHLIGDWVIREACLEAAGWTDPIRVAVNISAAQLTGAGLAKTVLGALATSRLEPERLELEVTESVFLGDDAATLASLERLRSIGVRLVLDDFGKGYSSFGYLSRAQFAKIKIDQSFVRGAAEGAKDCAAIVHAILALAQGLGVETTAEGVETEKQARYMRRVGCDQLQGFHFGRPVTADRFEAQSDNKVVRIA